MVSIFTAVSGSTKKVVDVVEETKPTEQEVDVIARLQEANAKLAEERDNYKNVALQRKGKLPGDAEFFKESDNGELTVAEQVKLELINREMEQNRTAEKAEIERIRKENNELRLAIKNRPSSSIGGDSGASSEVKDNVFSPAQIEALRAKATRLKADPEKFIQAAKENLMKRA